MFRFVNSNCLNLGLMLSVAAAASVASADQQAGTASQIPNTAFPLFQTQPLAGSGYSIVSSDSDTSLQELCTDSLNGVMSDVGDRLRKSYAEYQCQEVYLQWDTPVSRDGLFDRYRYYKVTVNAYCLPRSLQQRQILSLQKACEKDPKPECFQKDFLDYLGNLRSTVYVQLNKPNC